MAVLVEDKIIIEVFRGVFAVHMTHKVGLADASDRTFRTEEGSLTQNFLLFKYKRLTHLKQLKRVK